MLLIAISFVIFLVVGLRMFLLSLSGSYSVYAYIHLCGPSKAYLEFINNYLSLGNYSIFR